MPCRFIAFFFIKEVPERQSAPQPPMLYTEDATVFFALRTDARLQP